MKALLCNLVEPLLWVFCITFHGSTHRAAGYGGAWTCERPGCVFDTFMERRHAR